VFARLTPQNQHRRIDSAPLEGGRPLATGPVLITPHRRYEVRKGPASRLEELLETAKGQKATLESKPRLLQIC